MVNAAGYVHLGALLDCTGREWDFHSISTSNLCTARSMYSAGYAPERRWSIINLSSRFSSIKGLHRYFYGATKGTVIGLTKALTATPFVTARLILRHSR